MTSEHIPTPSRLALAASLPVKPSSSTIEKAYVRGLKEGMRRGEARRAELLADKNELVIRLKTARGEARRLRLLLGETLPNLADYAVMVADQPGSLWSRIHTETAAL